MKRSPEAVRKILDVATAIEVEPQRYRQEWWASIPVVDIADDLPYPGVIDPCATAFCVAGWNHFLHHSTEDWLELGYRHHDGDDADWHNLNWTCSGVDITEETIRDFELRKSEDVLISSHWRPKGGLTVPQALRLLAYGATVNDITHPEVLERWVTA